jgi:phosphoenolpyruvate-protein kinase (PTS system EI component)
MQAVFKFTHTVAPAVLQAVHHAVAAAARNGVPLDIMRTHAVKRCTALIMIAALASSELLVGHSSCDIMSHDES